MATLTSWPNIHELVEPLLGTPYAETNCWQVVQVLYKAGWQLDLAGDPRVLMESFAEVWWFQDDPRSPLLLVQPWDLLLFSIKGLVGDHCAVVLDDRLMVHPRKKLGVVREPMTRLYPKLWQILRLKELL
jgi:cell wall-associated NlpC family hydrolase